MALKKPVFQGCAWAKGAYIKTINFHLMRILYKFPSRSRPKKFIECIENIYNLHTHSTFTILATLDEDDVTMSNEEMKEKIATYPEVVPVYGYSKGKIDAVNRDMTAVPEWDILINMSDDMRFVAKGFDTQIVGDMTERFPGLDGMLHYPDGNRSDLITMAIMGRKYYDLDGYIYCPEYESVFADDEQTIVAKKRYAYKFIDKILFRHLHPAWGLSPMDEQYARQDSPHQHARDREVFTRRKENNFYLTKT